MPLFIAEINLAEIGKLLGGVTGLLVALAGLIVAVTAYGTFALKRSAAKTKKDVAEMLEKSSKDVAIRFDDMVASHLESKLLDLDPESFYTLDIVFKDGMEIAVPMIPMVEITVAKNLHLYVSDHCKEETEIHIRSSGLAILPAHSHANTSERIEVRRGSVTHLEPKRIYRAGEVWDIPKGEVHSALFSENFKALIIHRPALPTAKVRPVNLAGLKSENH